MQDFYARQTVIFGPFATQKEAEEFNSVGHVFTKTGELIPYRPSAYASPRRGA